MFDIKKLLIITSSFFLIAQAGITSSFAATDSRLVQKAEDYLNSITGLEGGFVQAANSGKMELGRFYMLRPGKLRLDYDKMPVQLISDGSNMFFYDKSLDQITTIPTNSTPASILTRKTIDLTGADIKVVGTQKTADGFSLSLVLKDNPGLGEMKVLFLDGPAELAGWELMDATGSKTVVSLKNLATRTNFPKGFFNVQRHKVPGAGGDKYYE
ncbi:MAG: outer membrane lipoprotein carrier protein LolA [Rickettsiales bacterium]|jgi:outer membrane lipoprotein-sorting protein|nr:outer membrane lipoprotein carrier protein LolA [Rickettsiales bacterium]